MSHDCRGFAAHYVERDLPRAQRRLLLPPCSAFTMLEALVRSLTHLKCLILTSLSAASLARSAAFTSATCSSLTMPLLSPSLSAGAACRLLCAAASAAATGA